MDSMTSAWMRSSTVAKAANSGRSEDRHRHHQGEGEVSAWKLDEIGQPVGRRPAGDPGERVTGSHGEEGEHDRDEGRARRGPMSSRARWSWTIQITRADQRDQSSPAAGPDLGSRSRQVANGGGSSPEQVGRATRRSNWTTRTTIGTSISG